MNVHFSSKKTKYETPQWLFDWLDSKWNFNLDPCATPYNAKCYKYFTEKGDGLSQNWAGHNVFVNPPYGREISKWVKKANREGRKPNTLVVMLIPARTDTSYWHDYIFNDAACIQFLRGRLKFGDETNSAPFPSAIIYFCSDYYIPEPIIETVNLKEICAKEVRK